MAAEELQQPLAEESGGGLRLAIATTFSVAQDDGELVIKQEPQELIPEIIPPEVMDEHESCAEMFGDEPIDDNLAQVYPEVSDVIMQRAVSPPTFIDPDEQRIEKLMLLYKEKFKLKDVTVELESCDKIWETLQLIKNIQGSLPEEVKDSEITSPKNSSTNQATLPGPFIPYQPILGNNNKALPDFRFSVKSKKRLYHCITCGKEFVDSQNLKQHAIAEHGVFVNPKRIYKPRADMIRKNSVTSDSHQNTSSEAMETEDVMPTEQPIVQPNQDVAPVAVPEYKIVESSLDNNSKADESQVKSNSGKEKIKCVLCKRICTDIVYHMRGYHKVGCITSIIAQCEKVLPERSSTIDATNPEKKSLISEPIEIDINESLACAVKKRKRNAPRWTVQKKKYKFNDGTFKSSKNGPFKCNVCLGYYKSAKSFSYHKRIHMKRGETSENFDPSKCRFINSPLRTKKGNLTSANATNSISEQNENTIDETSVTDYDKEQKVHSEIQNDELSIADDPNMEMNDGNKSERTSCDCGRSFRNYHTMYLHKVKCRRTSSRNSDRLHSQNSNDTDSGISISIKIKKNKNDSYEVVPTNAAVEENYKDSRSCKDSDASSNDSGMVSVDFNNQKVDSTELSKYSKGHSILRIQVAENDEEVDIEDGDSINSNLNEDNDGTIITSENNLESISSCSTEPETTTKTVVRLSRSTVKRNNIVPSLTTLCKQVLSKSKQEMEQNSTYKCQTCSTFFKNKIELMEHASKMQHDAKSICPCGKKFKNLKYFNIHVRRYHPLLLKCSYCNTNFDRIEKYTDHSCEVTEGKLFIEPIIQTQCLQCKVLVDLGEPFDKHMKTHNPDSTTFYQCFKCELRFDNSHQRRSHFSKEHGFSLCRICGKLLHIDYLSKHEAYHDGLGHPCHLCKKAFAHKTLLKKHIQGIHDPLVNEIVKCIVCSKGMKLKYLKKHMSFHLHTEICRKCNKCYRSDEQKNLEDHIANDHPNDYPTLKCDTCNISFVSDKRYEEHYQENACKLADIESITFVQNDEN